MSKVDIPFPNRVAVKGGAMRGSPCAQAPSCSRAERGNSQSRAPAALGLRTSLSPRSVPKLSPLASCLDLNQRRKVDCFLACLDEMQGFSKKWGRVRDAIALRTKE
jgi:hypothetical protein